MKSIDQWKTLKTMIEFSHDMILFLDPYGIIMQANPAALSLTGFKSTDDFQNKSIKFADLFDLYDLNNTKVSLAQLPDSRALSGESIIDFKGKGISKATGKAGYWLYSAIPVFDETEKITGVVLSIKETGSTECKQLEDMLQKSEAFLDSIIDQNPNPIWISDASGTLIRINQACLDMLSVSAEAVAGKYNILKDNIVEEQGYMPLVKSVYEKGAVARFELVWDSTRLKHLAVKNYSFVVLDVNIFPVRNKKGEITNAIIQHINITEQRLFEKSLRESERKAREIFDISFGFLGLLTPEGILLDANKTALEFIGANLLDVTGKPFWETPWWSISPLTQKQIKEAIADAAKGILVRQETTHVAKDCTIHFVDFTIKPMFNEKHEVVLLIAEGRDITERKQAEFKLAERSRFIESIVNMTPDILYNYDIIDNVNVYSSNSFNKVLGYSVAEIQAMGDRLIPLLMHPDDYTRYQHTIIPKYTQLKDNEQIINEYRMKHKSGEWRWLTSNESIYLRQPGGAPRQIFGLIHDITESKLTVEALRESEYFFKESQRAANIGSYKLDFTTGYWKSSEVLDQIFGIDQNYSRSIQSWVMDIVHPDDRAMMDKYLRDEVVSKRQQFSKEYRIIRKSDGVVRWVDGLGRITFDNQGTLISMLGTIQDITERKRAEESLRESEEKFTKIFRSAPVIIGIIDIATGRYIDINESALDVSGFSQDEIIGHTSVEIGWISPEIRARFLNDMQLYGRIDKAEMNFIAKGGQTIIGLLSCERVSIANKDCFLVSWIDITERKKAEEARNRLTRELRALSDCNQVLIRAENEQILLDRICRIICEVAGYRMVWVGFTVEEGSPYLKIAAHAVIGAVIMMSETYTLNEQGETPIEIVMRSKKSSITQDFEYLLKGTVWSDSALKNGCKSAIALPLLDEAGDVFGVLSIYSEEPNVFSAEEIKLLEELGGDLAYGIVNLRSRVERMRTQRSLAYEKKLSDALIEASPGIFCVMDASGMLLRMNTNLVKLQGESQDPLHFVYRNDYGLAKQDLERLPEAGHLEDDIRFEFTPGEISWWRMSGHAITITGTVYLITTGLNITSQKHTEENLQKALKEKEVLIQELYHRTKNNMQVISAYLAMQAIILDDKKLQIIFNEMENRIRAMALVHEKLYKSKDLTNINLRDYLSDLTKLLFDSFPNVSGTVTFAFEAEEVFVKIDIGIPIGLVVTELLTNSLKYAFPQGRSGEIFLRVQKHGAGELELILGDNGVGASGSFDPRQKGTLGIPTVYSLVCKQLRGTVELDTSEGFKWKILLRSDIYSERV